MLQSSAKRVVACVIPCMLKKGSIVRQVCSRLDPIYKYPVIIAGLNSLAVEYYKKLKRSLNNN